MPKSIIRPKWLDDASRDKKVSGHSPAYISNLKKATREVAGRLWHERGGNDPMYLALREAYAGLDIPNEQK